MVQRQIANKEGGNSARLKLNDVFLSSPVSDLSGLSNSFGVDDDTVAIQNALDTYGVVHLAPGVYRINDTITLNDGQKLIGCGITQRYPYGRYHNDGQPVRGSSLRLTGNSMTKAFQLDGFGNEIRGFFIEGPASNLDSIISIEFGGGNNIIEDVFIRDITSTGFKCIDCPGSSNSNIIRRCYFYDGDYGIYMSTPQYFITIQDCRFIGLGEIAIWANGGTSLYVSNCDFEQMGDCAVELSVNASFNFRFENIHIEWAFPFIRFNANLNRKGTVEIDGVYAWGDEAADFLEMNAPYDVSIRNAYLYGFEGYDAADTFPIANYDTYSHDIVLENVLIRDYQLQPQITHDKQKPNFVPKITTAQRNALSAENGMVIYNTTTNKFQGYENGAWVNII